jgi:hypothetical protein
LQKKEASVLTIDTFGSAKQIQEVGPTAHFQFFDYPITEFAQEVSITR